MMTQGKSRIESPPPVAATTTKNNKTDDDDDDDGDGGGGDNDNPAAATAADFRAQTQNQICADRIQTIAPRRRAIKSSNTWSDRPNSEHFL